jgi:DNA transposition AAA+ family ATPase
MQALEQLLVDALVATCCCRKVVVVYSLGGIGKTQLAVEFAQKH